MSEWQPIETAPRDGTHILTGRNLMLDPPGWEWRCECSFWTESFEKWYGWPRLIPPTHWMPLPSPPEDARS